MTPELWKLLVGAIVLLLTEAAGLLKIYSELAKVKAARAETKSSRDADSLAIHDAIQKLTWDNGRLKDEIGNLREITNDHQAQVSVLTTELAKLSVKMDNVLEAIQKLEK